MIVLNEFMGNLLRHELLPKRPLAPTLQDILDGGVKHVGNCVVFERLHTENHLPSDGLIQQRYVDLVGYEAAVNCVQLTTLCEGAPMATALHFLNQFALRWPNGHGTAVAILDCENDEHAGLTCKFRFHIKRENMVWLHPPCIDDITQAVLIREIVDQGEMAPSGGI